MFATNKATGPGKVLDEVQIFQMSASNTPHGQLLSDCIAWLKERNAARLGAKKFVLYEYARQRFGNSLTHAVFDAAYLTVFGRGRGRPTKTK
jgi:hypothetical protein